MSTGTTIRIADPVKSLERCYERRHEARALAARAEADGMPGLARSYRRRAAALSATITRIGRQYLGAS